MGIPQIPVQCFDHITSFPFALVSRLRPGQGKASEQAADAMHLMVDASSLCHRLCWPLVETSAEVTQLAKLGNDSWAWRLLQQHLCLLLKYLHLLNRQDLGDPISCSFISQEKVFSRRRWKNGALKISNILLVWGRETKEKICVKVWHSFNLLLHYFVFALFLFKKIMS